MDPTEKILTAFPADTEELNLDPHVSKMPLPKSLQTYILVESSSPGTIHTKGLGLLALIARLSSSEAAL